MKTLRLLVPLLLAAAVLSGCKKEDSPADPNAGSNARFKVTGVKDVDLSLSSSGKVDMPVQVITNTGAQPDTVSLQVTGLPHGVSTNFSRPTGKTSFDSRIQFVNNFDGAGGSYPVNVVATGKSGVMTYPMILTVPGFIGWTFNDSVYSRAAVVKDAGRVSGYPFIYIDATNRSRLVVNFPYKAELPTKTTTYKVGATPSAGTVQLQFIRDSTQVFVSTAAGSPTATFVFDSVGKFILKCSNVQMSNGVRTGTLNVSVPE